MTNDPASIVALGDFVISQFRKELGLWYDINEADWDESIASQAHITDGKSFLIVWVTGSPPSAGQFVQLRQESNDELFLAWQTRHDSHRIFDLPLVKSVANRAVERFTPEHEKDEDRVHLLSFEFTGSSPLGDVNVFFDRHFGDAIVNQLPLYEGRLRDNPEFELSPDPYASWLQLTFSTPMSRKSLIESMSIALLDMARFAMGKNESFRPSQELKQLNVNRVRCFGRRW